MELSDLNIYNAQAKSYFCLPHFKFSDNIHLM